MAFELFDLKSTLRIHNQMHGKNRVEVDTTFGLEVFSAEFKEFLSKGFELYHNAYYLHKGFEGKRIREYQAQLANSRSISALKKLVSRRASDGKATNSFLLREKRGKGYATLNEGFAHYTHYALLEAYDYLRTLESRLLYAEQQVRNARFRLFNQVPQDVIENYSQYVKKQLNLIHKEYQKLTRAMVSRLTLASGDISLEHGDVLFHLDPKGLMEDKLTQNSFQDFYHVIHSCGDRETKKRLAKLPWVAMVNQLSNYPSLCKPTSLYNLARLEIASRQMRSHDKSAEQTEEGLKAALEVVQTAQHLIQEEQKNFSERELFFNKWWRRLFKKQNLTHLRKIQHSLQAEAESLQKHKATIEHKLSLLASSLNNENAKALSQDVEVGKPEVKDEAINIADNFKYLEELLLKAVSSKFNLSNESLEYLRKLKVQMLERGIVDVKNILELTITDKTFLGLTQKGYCSLFFEDDRKIISLTLNMVVLLNKESEVLAKITNESQRDMRMEKVTSDIYRYLEKYGTSEIQEIMRTRAEHVRSN